MTIRLGKALYYCQKCWKASKENKSASTFAGQRKASVPKVAPPKVAPKPVVKPIQETPINKPNPAATNNQLPQNRPEQEPAKLKPEPTVQTVEVTPKAQEAENKEEELKPLAPSVPASVTTAAMKADDTAEDLADSAGTLPFCFLREHPRIATKPCMYCMISATSYMIFARYMSPIP